MLAKVRNFIRTRPPKLARYSIFDYRVFQI